MKTKSIRFAVVMASLFIGMASFAYGEAFPVGGAIYTDLASPHTTGLQDVSITVMGDNGVYSAQTQGMGLWQIDDVPEGIYTVTPSRVDKDFEHVQDGVPDGQSAIVIMVNADNLAANQSISFLAQDAEPVSQYTLTATVVDGHGTITPATGTYDANTPVILTAHPDEGYAVLAWGGTDDDTSEANTNTVTMSSDKTVTVEFIAAGEESYTIGGTIYTDLASPTTSGLSGVTVTIDDGEGAYIATTSGSQGLWQIVVPVGDYTITPSMSGWTFASIDSQQATEDPCAAIVVNQENQAANQSIQFLAVPSEITINVTATDSLASEPSDDGNFRITRTGNVNDDLEVHYSMSGSATNGMDYVTLSGIATIPDGLPYVDIPLQVNRDEIEEGSETALLTLEPDSAYVVSSGNGSATVTITDYVVRGDLLRGIKSRIKKGKGPNNGKFMISGISLGIDPWILLLRADHITIRLYNLDDETPFFSSEIDRRLGRYKPKKQIYTYTGNPNIRLCLKTNQFKVSGRYLDFSGYDGGSIRMELEIGDDYLGFIDVMR